MMGYIDLKGWFDDISYVTLTDMFPMRDFRPRHGICHILTSVDSSNNMRGFVALSPTYETLFRCSTMKKVDVEKFLEKCKC